MKHVEIIVVTHKKYAMPTDDIYLPLQVGAKLAKAHFGYQADDEKHNISAKNPEFCELTGLYWLWQNSTAQVKGITHYRRHLTTKPPFLLPRNRLSAALSGSELTELLKEVPLILPKKQHYYIETLWSHYQHTLDVKPLEQTEQIIQSDYPEFYPEFKKLKTRTSAHMFNIFITKAELFDEYASWLFEVLFKLEKKLAKTYTPKNAFHARFYGRISELLFDVWLNTKHKDLNYKELNVLNVEKINWFKKGTSFLLAKFTGKKYDKSF